MKKATKSIILTGVLLIVLGGALVTAGFATGLIPTLLVSPDKELAAREAAATFAANNGLVSTAESGSKSTDDPIVEESAQLILCGNVTDYKDAIAECIQDNGL